MADTSERGLRGERAVTDQRLVPRMDVSGIHLRCQVADPGWRWWRRPPALIGWIVDLSASGARLRLPRNRDLRPCSLVVISRGSSRGEAEIRYVRDTVDLTVVEVGIRFLSLDRELERFVYDHLDGNPPEGAPGSSSSP
jgi:hypothetical protein